MKKIREIVRQMGLKQKLILVFALFILLNSLFLSAVSMSLFSQKEREKNYRYISDITYQTVNNLEFLFGELDDITFAVLSSSLVQNQLRAINQVSNFPSQRLNASKDIERFLSIYTLYNADIVSLSVHPIYGKEIVSRSIQQTPTKSVFTKAEILAAGGSAIWGLTPDEDREICVARAILDLKTQLPIGYISIVVRQKYVAAVMGDITISHTSGSYILDQQGQVISSNLPHMAGAYLPELAGNGDNWANREVELSGVPSYLYQGKRMDNGWTLVTVIPKNELIRESVWFYTILVLVDIMVISVVVSAVWVLVKRITSPFDRLCQSMEEVGKGHFERREVISTNDEVGKLSHSFNDMVDNIQELIEKVYTLEITERQAELEVLKMQINPHFLYNTLDTINWMARAQNNLEIADMTMALGNLLHANLKQDDSVTIAQEAQNIRNYLLIQKYRFGARLSWEIDIDLGLEDYYIPSFILQPLVENAIIHGLERKAEKGSLHLEVQQQGEGLVFRLWDNGVGMSQKAVQDFMEQGEGPFQRSSIGLKNVDRRLRLYYGDGSGLQIESVLGQGTGICFRIPVQKCLEPLQNKKKMCQ